MNLPLDSFSRVILGLAAWCFGCCVGSFLNVCIWRIPRGESVAWPPSHCPTCGAAIKWYQNLPIISWLALRGKCAVCKKPISPRYLMVEILGGGLVFATYLQLVCPGWWGTVPLCDPWMIAVYTLVFAGLILGSAVDLAEFWIPDRVTIGGMIIGPIASFCVGELQGLPMRHFQLSALIDSLIGLALGFGSMWLLGFVFSKIFRKDALGFGDVKLFGAIGAFFGASAVLFVMIVSSFVGAAWGVVMIIRGRTRLGGFTAVPYGPFIAVATVVWMLWGETMLKWYLGILS